MLTRIEIDGFKSFEKFDVSLSPFVVILGTNASGKSNLFDAIRLLSNLATKDVSEALKDMRGEPLEQFRKDSNGHVREMSLAVEVLVDPTVRDPWGTEVELTHTRIRYEIKLERRELRPGVERVVVSHEVATPILRKDDAWSSGPQFSSWFRAQQLKYKRSVPLLETQTNGGSNYFEIRQDGRQGRKRPAVGAEASVLSSITNTEFAHLYALREEMRGWRLLQLDPLLLRKPSPLGSPDILQTDGANLAAVLARIKAETRTQTRPDGVLSAIAAQLNSLVPGVKRIDVEPDDREYRVEISMRDGIPFSSRVVSDGTLRILALLTLLNDPRHRGVVCFEEPENGIHPARLGQLVGTLEDTVSDLRGLEADERQPLSQLLLNSHSPVVLASLMRQGITGSVRSVMFADMVTVTDTSTGSIRRKTRLRPVKPFVQGELDERDRQLVSATEVHQILATVSADA